jgi:hypothetical protein
MAIRKLFLGLPTQVVAVAVQNVLLLPLVVVAGQVL